MCIRDRDYIQTLGLKLVAGRELSRGNGQGVYSKLWTNGFLDSVHQGVQFSNSDERVLYLNDMNGLDRKDRRNQLDELSKLNSLSYEKFGDPEIKTLSLIHI